MNGTTFDGTFFGGMNFNNSCPVTFSNSFWQDDLLIGRLSVEYFLGEYADSMVSADTKYSSVALRFHAVIRKSDFITLNIIILVRSIIVYL